MAESVERWKNPEQRPQRADENDEADLRQDVDGHAPREQACDRGEQAHRHDQDDCQRQLPAFVLRDEDEEDEESGCAEDEKSRRAALPSSHPL
jgi:hypothetical protein